MDYGVTNNPSPSYYDKWRFTLYTVLVALLIFNPWTYKLVNSLLSGLIGTIAYNGCPNVFGFGIHIVVFTLIVRFLMDLHI
jgi:hypothetical protein